MSKLKILPLTLAVVLCMTAFSVPAHAAGCYASNEDGKETPPDAIDSIVVGTEEIELPDGIPDGILDWLFSGGGMGEPLTPDGNLTLVDDFFSSIIPDGGDESERQEKQFITLQSKNGNYFYLVIDRAGDTENVYFLNLVDEADLMALLEESGGQLPENVCTCADKCVVGSIDTDCPVCRVNMSECTGKEAVADPEPEKEPDTAPDKDKPDTDEPSNSGKSTNLLPVLVLVVALAGGGAFYFLKVRKKSPKTKGATDLDEYDFGEDDGEDEETEIDDAELAEDAPDEDVDKGEA